MPTKKEVRDILKKYEKRLAESTEFDEFGVPSRETFSREYRIFKNEALAKRITFYERICKKTGAQTFLRCG